MTYIGFHLVFLAPPIAAIGWLLWRRRATIPARCLWAVGAMCTVALLYTLPWDNYLVREAIWSYGPDRVVATVGYVPIEEVLFFVLQPLLVGGFFLILRLRRSRPNQSVMHGKGPVSGGLSPGRVYADRTVRVVGLSWFATLAVSGFWAAGWAPWGPEAPASLRYAGLIGAWCGPVLAGQWALFGHRLATAAARVLPAIVWPAVYLCAADAVAIADGIWSITRETSTGVMVFGLPVEEGAFFFATTTMVVFGIEMLAPARADVQPPT